MPPNKQYGVKDGTVVDRSGPRTAPKDGVHQFIEQQSQTSENAYRKPLLTGRGATQPRSKKRPSRRQGYLPLDPSNKQAANVQGQLHVGQYLGNRRKRKRKVAQLMAKRSELMAVRQVLKHQQTVQRALQQADEALQSVNNSRIVPGYHPDHTIFDVWKVATEIVQARKAQPVTMKGLI
jgi:hypothetical protein